jgi:lipopolysaccharide transport system ATP-binding protein
MAGEPAISMHGVSKRYEVFGTQRGRLLHALWPRYRDGMQEIWALRGVDLEVRRGESVAVIGRNGGGKSTLLQILTGVLEPTQGEVRVEGRVSALLELGSGFNPEYTGRDNVLLNGLLLGLSREEILGRFDEIAAFAEIGDAIDRPVKTYSSGMLMRLAFAVQVLTEPEILVIDEALSVGDFFFQQKCFRHIRGLCEKGVTLVFVSHDMRTVRDLCEKAVYVREGRVAFAGDSKAAIRAYLRESAPPGTGAGAAAAPAEAVEVPLHLPADVLWRRADASSPGPLLAVQATSADGKALERIRIGDTLRLRIFFTTAGQAPGHISVVLKNRYDQVVSTLGSYTSGLPALASDDGSHGVFQLDVDMMVEAGEYTIMVAFGRPIAENTGQPVEDTGWIGPIRVDWDYASERAPFLGMFGLPVRAELLSPASPALEGPSLRQRSIG